MTRPSWFKPEALPQDLTYLGQRHVVEHSVASAVEQPTQDILVAVEILL